MFKANTHNARFIVVALAFGWGLNWISSRIILEWLPPWTMRTIGIGCGAATLLLSMLWRGEAFALSRRQVLHVTAAAGLNVFIFNLCSAYAQIFGTTGRAIVIAYSMPIWAAMLARVVLKEPINGLRLLALAMCVAGLATLIAPQLHVGLPLGALFALGAAWTWAAGTIYLKWAEIDANPLAITTWQLLIGFAGLAAGMLITEGLPQLSKLPLGIYGLLAYTGFVGLGLCYFAWFVVVKRLPAITASLGTLLVPVVGVFAATLLIGEIPTLNDFIGFGLIFAAAICVLL
jgi:drug/metabolite transporter (DMT)-like permease